MANYPAIPEPTNDPNQLRDSVLALKQAFEILSGQRGLSMAAALTPASAGTIVPLTDGVAGVGTSAKWAHEDHVHPLPNNVLAAAWSTWTPTFAMGVVGGTPATFALVSAHWVQIGKIVFFSLDAQITAVGVGNGGGLIFSLPVTVVGGSGIVSATGKEVINTGKLVAVQGASSTSAQAVFYDNTSLISGGNGTRIQISGFYEAA